MLVFQFPWPVNSKTSREDTFLSHGFSAAIFCVSTVGLFLYFLPTTTVLVVLPPLMSNTLLFGGAFLAEEPVRPESRGCMPAADSSPSARLLSMLRLRALARFLTSQALSERKRHGREEAGRSDRPTTNMNEITLARQTEWFYMQTNPSCGSLRVVWGKCEQRICHTSPSSPWPPSSSIVSLSPPPPPHQRMRANIIAHSMLGQMVLWNWFSKKSKKKYPSGGGCSENIPEQE